MMMMLACIKNCIKEFTPVVCETLAQVECQKIDVFDLAKTFSGDVAHNLLLFAHDSTHSSSAVHDYSRSIGEPEVCS